MGSAATVASEAASAFGALGGNDVSNTNDVGAENALLSQAQQNALGYSQNYSNQAVQQQNTSLSAALAELGQAMTSVSNTVTNGFNNSQALNTPIRNAGYQALDNYEDSLHMSRPKMGNQAVADALSKQSNVTGQMQALAQGQGNLNAMYNPGGTIDPTQMGAAPTLDAVRNTQITPDQINQYVKDHISEDTNAKGGYFGYNSYNGVGAGSAASGSQGGEGSSSGAVSNNALGSWGADSNWENQNHYIGNSLAQPLLSKADAAYAQQQYNYNNLGQYLQSTYNPAAQSIANAYNAGMTNNLGVQNLYSITGGSNSSGANTAGNN